jgi:hypothetical protein
MNDQTVLNKKEFLDLAGNLACELVPVHELKPNGVIKLRELTGEARDKLEAMSIKDGAWNPDNFRARSLSLGIINEDGTLMFTSDEIEMIGRSSGKLIVRLFNRLQVLSGLGKKAMDEIEKNSAGPSPKGGSSSD